MSVGMALDLDEWFPPAVVAARRAKLTRFWHGEADAGPVILPIDFTTIYRHTPDPDEALAKFVVNMKVDARNGCDIVPAFTCDLGAVSLASAFGGKVIQSDREPPWIEPVVRGAEDVERLKLPGVTDGMVGQAVRVYEHVRQRVRGDLPVRVPDMQGPLNTAALVWEQQDFLTAMYESPAAVHRLLEMATTHIINVFEYFRDQFGDAMLVNWPPVWMPGELGVGITEDLMPLLSPGLYEEFGRPYVDRIARRFGGVFVHCCGVFNAQWDAVSRFPGLRGLDTAYPCSDPAELHAKFPGVVHSNGLAATGFPRFEPEKNPDAFLEFRLARTPRDARALFVLDGSDEDGVRRQAGMIREWWAGV